MKEHAENRKSDSKKTKESQQLSRVSGDDSSSQHSDSDNDKFIFRMEDINVMSPRNNSNGQESRSSDRKPNDRVIASASNAAYQLPRSQAFESYGELQASLSPPRDQNRLFGQRAAQANVENQASVIGMVKEWIFGKAPF